MKEVFEFITAADEHIIIPLADTVKRKQLSNCHRQTSFQQSHAKHVTSRNSAPRIQVVWEGTKKFFHAVRSNIYEMKLRWIFSFNNHLMTSEWNFPELCQLTNESPKTLTAKLIIRVLLFQDNFAAGDTSLLQVFRCYWIYDRNCNVFIFVFNQKKKHWNTGITIQKIV